MAVYLFIFKFLLSTSVFDPLGLEKSGCYDYSLVLRFCVVTLERCGPYSWLTICQHVETVRSSALLHKVSHKVLEAFNLQIYLWVKRKRRKTYLENLRYYSAAALPTNVVYIKHVTIHFYTLITKIT